MSSHAYLDTSPPAYDGPKDRLVKSAFRKTLSVLAARVPPNKTGQILKAQPLKGFVIKHRFVSSAHSLQGPHGLAKNSKRCF